MGTEELIKERIRFLTEYLKILWVVLIATSGGSAGLFINLDSPKKAILLLIGVIVITITSSIIGALTLEVLRLFERLKEEARENG